jgi:hypothetical protein
VAFWRKTFPVGAPSSFVFDWMTTPDPSDAAFTPGLEAREIKEKWKLQWETHDQGTIGGRRYSSKAVLRLYPTKRWRLEEEADAFYHRTEFSLTDTPEGCEMSMEMEVIVRGALKLREKSFTKKLHAGFEARMRAWVAKMEEVAHAGVAPAEVPSQDTFDKKQAPRDVPRQYGS